MSSTPAPRTFDVRHVQLARAAFAALAAVMITFSPDHSAAVGIAVFSGWAIACATVFFLAVWVVHPAGERWPSVLLGLVTVTAGMVGGVTVWRTTPVFFAVVVTWAILAGLIETIAGARARRAAGAGTQKRSEGRDAVVIGVVTLVLGVAMLLVPTRYALTYFIEDAGREFTLTGITIGVGLFGAYAAIVAVYLAIAGLSPRTQPAAQPTAGGEPAPDRESAA